MAADTSPNMTGLSGGGYEIAFQANTGYLYTYSSSSGAAGTTLGMASGTSPGITLLADNNWEIVFQANSNDLYNYSSLTGPAGTSYSMAAGTSPHNSPPQN
jgi:hypothetical protein